MSIIDEGYEIIQLTGNANVAVVRAAAAIEKEIGDLYTYHERATANDEKRIEEHTRLAAMVAGIPRLAIGEHLEYFRRLIGSDLMLQSKPYLRISRPGVEEDNIGFHRDTWYGDTSYECSVWIPLTNTDVGNSLSVAPKSHVWSERAHPTERVSRPDVPKGSPKHSLGFIYDSPKRLVSAVQMTPLPVKVGQMIIFPLSLLHGQEVNKSTVTRFSVDCRIANALAPIKMARSRDANYYERWQTSPITAVALAYERANGK